MSDLIWHPDTLLRINRFAVRPSHAVLLTAPAGSGKYTAAVHLIRILLHLKADMDVTSHHAVKTPRPADEPTITIEFIRELRDFVKLKSVSNDTTARVIFLPNAERMQVAAQNALLKILEEPPTDTVIVLTAPSERALLPTITSRTQELKIQNPTLTDLKTHFSGLGHDPSTIERMAVLSNGRIGLLAALLDQSTDHPLAGSVLLAKELLQSKPYERLTKVDDLSKDKERLSALLDALEQVVRAAMSHAATARKTSLLQKLHNSLVQLDEAKTALRHNVQAKLILTHLFLNM